MLRNFQATYCSYDSEIKDIMGWRCSLDERQDVLTGFSWGNTVEDLEIGGGWNWIRITSNGRL
jgi:hypothetical protein